MSVVKIGNKLSRSDLGIDNLAIFGGPPKFHEDLHVGRPNIIHPERFIQRVNDILDCKWLTNNGPYVQEFENQIASYLGVRHCIAVCNGTAGLEIAIKALGIRGEVIVPSFTFIATAHALHWLGIKPLFCDVDPETHNIDPIHVRKLINERTTGIVGVHLWGRPCAVDELAEIADQHGLKLLYDAAHAFGSTHNCRMIGNFGDAEVFSFHATKFLHAIEGGAIVTNNDELAEKFRQLKDFGYTQDHEIVAVGTNGKMNEVSAAMGLTMLEGISEIIGVNQRNYKIYQSKLSGIPGVRLASYNESERCNYQYIVLEIDAEEAGISRDQLHDILRAEKVLVRKYFAPACHQTRPYLSSYFETGGSLPVTENLSDRTLCLPNGMAVGPGEISKICELIQFVVANSKIIEKSIRFAQIT